MDRFVGKLAIVTGASSGIGECMSRELVKRGLIVVGLARRFDKLQMLAQEINSDPASSRFHPLKCDITNEEDIRNAFSYANKIYGPPSILVNNAGIITDKNFEDITAHDFDVIFDTNSKGLLLAAKEAIKLMNENSIAGHILNINSVAGYYIYAWENIMLYSASKHTNRIFSEILRRANTEKKANIKISNISPGAVKTEITDQVHQLIALDDNPNTCMTSEDVVKACITVLDTPPNVLISELAIMPLHTPT